MALLKKCVAMLVMASVMTLGTVGIVGCSGDATPPAKAGEKDKAGKDKADKDKADKDKDKK